MIELLQKEDDPVRRQEIEVEFESILKGLLRGEDFDSHSNSTERTEAGPTKSRAVTKQHGVSKKPSSKHKISGTASARRTINTSKTTNQHIKQEDASR